MKRPKHIERIMEGLRLSFDDDDTDLYDYIISLEEEVENETNQ